MMIILGLVFVIKAIWLAYLILFDDLPIDLSGPVSGWGTPGDWATRRSPIQNPLDHN